MSLLVGADYYSLYNSQLQPCRRYIILISMSLMVKYMPLLFGADYYYIDLGFILL